MKFLLVDDSATMRKVVGLALKSSGYDYIEADGGEEALKKIKVEKFDFFLVDLNMPVMPGAELIKKIREIPEHKKTPIIIITTETDQDMKNEGMKAGANDLLVKPFQRESLEKIIQKYS
jgi:two-component system, chemotaxis family, chemotaxis protein CheY